MVYISDEVCTYSCSLIDNSEYKMKFQSETNAVTISPQMFKIDLSQNGIRTDLAEQQELSLLSLPIEVLFGIFHYLDSLSLSCLSRVSKQIRYLVQYFLHIQLKKNTFIVQDHVRLLN